MTDLLATFTTPEPMGTTVLALLWFVPLSASIAIVYKATKVSTLETKAFARQTFVLFGSIVVFMVISALVLCAVAWVVSEKLPGWKGY